MSMFKQIRVLALLVLLLLAALGAYRDKSHDWKKPVYVALYPINVDNAPQVDAYIKTLTDKDFGEIETYLNAESKKHQKDAHFYYRLGNTVNALPPDVPRNGSIFDAIFWSLKFRYYAYKHGGDVGIPTNLKLFLKFHSADKPVLTEVSTALQNGRIGVVNLYGVKDKNRNNNVVIAHETLHAFGATDKYNLSNGIPHHPSGYANPHKQPLYPQTQAELMAVHIPITEQRFEMARTLDKTIIGEMTASEIGW